MANTTTTLVKYTYIHHPYYPEYVLTIARRWLNEEKTQLAVAWCANKCEFSGVAFAEDGYVPQLEVFDVFVKKTARNCSGGRLDSPDHRVVMQLDKPWNRKIDGSIVSRTIDAVQPVLPKNLQALLELAHHEGYKIAPGKRTMVPRFRLTGKAAT